MSYSKYKIVYCTPALYSSGGVERIVSVKASYFAEQLGYDVTIIVTEGNGRSSFFPLSDKVKVINFELDFEELWKASFLKRVYLFFKKQIRFRRLLKAEMMRIRPDITISTLRREINFIPSFMDGSIKLGELHVNRTNYRSFDSRSSNPAKRLLSYFWMKHLITHLRKLDKMVVLTDSALADWPELTNVVKIPDLLPFCIDMKSDLLKKRIISIGRYAYDKGNDLLLQIWSKVEKQAPEWRLDIFGNGDREPYYLQMQKLGIDTTRCHLFGPTNDVKKEYLNSSVFALPSRFEGFGVVIIEAMACGVPVVSFDCENGPRSIITDGVDGFLIPTFDIDAYADKVISLMTNESLRCQMGENARKTASQYDMAKIAPQWQQLFDELMPRK